MKMKVRMCTHILDGRIIFKPNPFPVIENHWPCLLGQRYAKASKKDDDGGDEKAADQRSKTDRAPSMAEEFDRVAAEKQLKEAAEEEEVADQRVGKESEGLDKTALDQGPGYRPCS